MTDEQTGKDEQTFVPIESLLQLKSGYSKLRPSISVAKVTLQPPMSIHLSVCLLSKPSNSIKSIIPHHQTQQQHTHYHTQHHKNHQLYHHTHQHHHLLIFVTFKILFLFSLPLSQICQFLYFIQIKWIMLNINILLSSNSGIWTTATIS